MPSWFDTQFVATGTPPKFFTNEKNGGVGKNQDPGFLSSCSLTDKHLKMDGVRKFQNLWFQIYNRLFGTETFFCIF